MEVKIGVQGLKKLIFLDIFHKSLCPTIFFLNQSKKVAKMRSDTRSDSDLTHLTRDLSQILCQICQIEIWSSLGLFKCHCSNCKHHSDAPRCPELKYVQHSDLERLQKQAGLVSTVYEREVPSREN